MGQSCKVLWSKNRLTIRFDFCNVRKTKPMSLLTWVSLISGGPTRTRTNLYLQTCIYSGHPYTVQSNTSVQTLDTPHLSRVTKRPEHTYRPEQTKRPESGRSDTGQSTLTVMFQEALLGRN